MYVYDFLCCHIFQASLLWSSSDSEDEEEAEEGMIQGDGGGGRGDAPVNFMAMWRAREAPRPALPHWDPKNTLDSIKQVKQHPMPVS